MNYQTITNIVQHVQEPANELPNQEGLAIGAGLSLFQFHQLFNTWASITPNSFFKNLTLPRLQQLLEDGNLDMESLPKIEVAKSTVPLQVYLDVATQAEVQKGVAGWKISAGLAETPFGLAFLAECPRGICHLSFLDSENEIEPSTHWEDLQEAWPNANFSEDDAAAAQMMDSILEAAIGQKSLKTPTKIKVYVRATTFQARVWRELLRIRTGRLISYSRLAQAIEQPTAARAVGAAVSQNPIAFIIPCHRVIHESGRTGDYRWNNLRKRIMIAWEASPRLV